jgi:hypothetical protein
VTGRARSWVLGGEELSVASFSRGLDAANRDLVDRLRVQEELLLTLREELRHMEQLRGELEQLRAQMASMRHSARAGSREAEG